MGTRQTTTGLLLLVVAAFAGLLLLAAPGWLIDQYERFAAHGPLWARLYLATVAVGGLLFLGATLWILLRLWAATRRKRRRRRQRQQGPSQLTRQQQESEIADNLAAVADLQADPAVPPEVRQQLEPLAEQLQQKQQQQTLEIVAFGTVSSGKSSLLNLLAGRDVFRTDAKGGTTVCRNEIPWPGVDKVTLVDTPGLGEVGGQARAAVSAQAAKDADLVLLVVDGPLRDSEFQLLEVLAAMEKRILVCLNKADWYGGDEIASLVGQIRQQVKELVRPEDVVAVASQPCQRTRVRVLPDGTQCEETVQVPGDIGPLADRMMQLVRRDGQDLLMANLLLRSRGMVETARQRVQAALDQRAWQIVDRYMWGAGGAAALSPFPLVDLAAGCAISSKMVVDLARVYRQDVDLNLAVNLLGQLGKNLIGILGASAATPAVASLVASLLKTVPGAGTLAGGLLQGVVQAVITRWIGAVFIELLKNEMQMPEGGLTDLARRQWDEITRAESLYSLVQAARQRLQGSHDEPQTDEA